MAKSAGQICGDIVFCICGPKGSLCCFVLSVWAVIMLVWFYTYTHTYTHKDLYVIVNCSVRSDDICTVHDSPIHSVFEHMSF